MDNSKKVIMGLLVIFLLLNFFTISNYFYQEFFTITGKGITGGVVFKINPPREITIHSPENISYAENKSFEDYYTPIYGLNLSVGAAFDVSSWRYDLIQTSPRGGQKLTGGSFLPNLSDEQFHAYRWLNNLTVYAKDVNEVEYSENVSFYLDVPRSSPLIDYISPELFVCEKSTLVYYFTATDRDEDDLTVSMSPSTLFFVGGKSVLNHTTTRFRLSSPLSLNKEYAGGVNAGSRTYSRTISVLVIENVSYRDSKDLNITVIERNNHPQIDNIGVQTVWTQGDDSSFIKQFWAEDEEEGDSNSGSLSFGIEFLDSEDLFKINETGWMYFKPNASHLDNGEPMTYPISVCVKDSGLLNPHENITTVCNQTGGTITVCNNFSLTVTNENRAPIIVDYYPSLNLEDEVSGVENNYFNVTTYDPDGTIPDIYWYVDDVLRKYTSGSLEDEFNHAFGCGVSGQKVVKAIATDGLLNDSISWVLDVTSVPCVVPPSSGGGGGGGAHTCDPEWACEDWQVCQNLERSLKEGFLTGEDYRLVRDECDVKGLDEIYCGFQLRDCIDLNECGLLINAPEKIQSCFFTEDPSCFDEIKNCHSGSCEIGVDCGGPCDPCPTCSDGIQNQGEEGIDCGGPCPWPCPVEEPFRLKFSWIYVLIFLLMVLIVVLIIKIRRVLHFKKGFKKVGAY